MEPETQTVKDKSLIERLFNAGAHFGFTKSRRHPTTLPYLYGNKQGVDIIDLEKTSDMLEEAKEVLFKLGSEGKRVLFVGTKEEIAPLVKNAAEETEMPYVTNRWIGGTLTNFSEIKKRIARFNDLTTQGETGELERKYTKKERVVIGRERERLSYNFEGIRTLEKLPNALLIVDPRHDSIAVQEATDLNIPIIGVTSSDCNLKNIAHPVLVNDALQSSIGLVLAECVTALNNGKAAYEPGKAKEEVKKTAA